MTWDRIMLPAPSEPRRSIETLFAEQLESWPLLRAGVEGLEQARSRVISVRGFDLIARHIPHRIHSTTARVDDATIRGRACFLCANSLPAEERAVALNESYVVTCNPYPILRDHVSVVSRVHRPQGIADGSSSELQVMLGLAASLPEHLVIYNGPECGASAPDHMHFQACHRQGVPVAVHLDTVSGGLMDGFPSRPLVLGDHDQLRLEETFRNLMAILRTAVPGRSEPMVNVVAVYDRHSWRLLVFPRLRHRPLAYHSGELTWTPGALDLAGIIVLPVAEDLNRVSAEMLERGFDDVCLSYDETSRIARELRLP